MIAGKARNSDACHPGMAQQEREILERAVRAGEQASAASAIVDEALDAGIDGSHPVTLRARMVRLELLKVKADLERSPRRPTAVRRCTGSLASVSQPATWRTASPRRTANLR